MDEQQVFDFLINQGRQEMLKELPAASCVAASKLISNILFRLDMWPALLTPVHFVTANSGGLVVLGRNPGATAGGTNIHLTVRYNNYLIDATLDQIGLAPSVFKMDTEFPIAVNIGGQHGMYFKDETDNRISYDIPHELVPLREKLLTFLTIAKD